MGNNLTVIALWKCIEPYTPLSELCERVTHSTEKRQKLSNKYAIRNWSTTVAQSAWTEMEQQAETHGRSRVHSHGGTAS